MLNLDRITNPLRLAQGSHQPGSGKGCAMNVISYINGDTRITDYPECSARPLSRLVQILNDNLAGSDGFLSPENSVLVLDLGWLTVGTASAPRETMLHWLADLLVDPVFGVVNKAKDSSKPAIIHVAELLLLESGGAAATVEQWQEARKNAAYAAYAAYAAAAYAAYAAADDAAYAAAYAAYAAAAYAAYAAADDAAYAADAAYADDAAYAASAYRVGFTGWAINRWRELQGLDSPEDITYTEVDTALARINA